MKKILFLCHGNICRSPMAEFVFKHVVAQNGKQDNYYIASAALSNEEIGKDVHYGTKNILNIKGVPHSSRQAVKFTPKDYEIYDYILIMDQNNFNYIKRILPNNNLNKVYKFLSFAGLERDIADPWYTGDFEQTYNDVLLASNSLIKYLEENI